MIFFGKNLQTLGKQRYDYNGMMELTENMFRHVAQEVCGTTLIPYGDVEIDLGKPFAKMTMTEAVKKYAGVDFDEIKDTVEAKKIADEKGVHYEDRHKKGDILNLFFEEFVEEHLVQPTFITTLDFTGLFRQAFSLSGKAKHP